MCKSIFKNVFSPHSIFVKGTLNCIICFYWITNNLKMATQLTDSNFKETVLDSNKVAMIDFWAEWCGPCRYIAPTVEELAKEYEGKAVIAKVNVDDNPETAMEYGIRSIPTILFFKGGKLVDKQIGVVPRNVLESKLKAQL